MPVRATTLLVEGTGEAVSFAGRPQFSVPVGGLADGCTPVRSSSHGVLALKSKA